MSSSFQTCPGCDSFILSDTASCPECGYVFDKDRAAAISSAADARDLKSQQIYNTCRSCGEQVRDGLVRCWKCNAFMRTDVENKYKELQSTPQPIIFSETESRSEFLTPEERQRLANRVSVFDAMDDSEFTLRASVGQASSPTTVADDDGFELSDSVGQATAPAAQTAAPQTPAETATPAAEANAPQTGAPQTGDGAANEKSNGEKSNGEKSNGEKSNGESRKSGNGNPKPGDLDDDDFVGIAMQDERDSRRRKRSKLEEARKRRILLPCNSCGSWIRVRQDQSGRTVRCRQCKAPMVVPTMKAKKKKKKSAGSSQSVKLDWLEDIRLNMVSPTDVTLKPGSLEKSAESVDLCFHESGLHLIKYAAPKKSLFGKASDGPPEVAEQKKLIREHISKSGKIADLPHVELMSVPTDAIASLRLVQPVAEAHESMFAGVPVFGEGRVAVYLPLSLPDSKQAFLAMTLSNHRRVSRHLQSYFGRDLGAEANGVPEKETFDINMCHLSEVKVESLQNVVYYENDPEFDLEVAGFGCATCGIVITEEARARKKLGGAAGKGIAKAKCPKCGSKMGDQKAWKITSSPEEETAVEEEDASSVMTMDLKAATGQTDSGATSAAGEQSAAEPDSQNAAPTAGAETK